MKLLMPITSAPIGRNRHMSISHRRDKPLIMAMIAVTFDYNLIASLSRLEDLCLDVTSDALNNCSF